MRRSAETGAGRGVPLVASLVAALAIVAPAAGGEEPPDAALNPLADSAASGLDGFLKRPLFAPSRRPPPPTVEATPDTLPETAATSDEPPAMRLLGIVRTPEETIAHVLETEGEQRFSFRVGDYAGNWRVAAIDSGTLTLSFDGREVVLHLRPERP